MCIHVYQANDKAILYKAKKVVFVETLLWSQLMHGWYYSPILCESSMPKSLRFLDSSKVIKIANFCILVTWAWPTSKPIENPYFQKKEDLTRSASQWNVFKPETFHLETGHSPRNIPLFNRCKLKRLTAEREGLCMRSFIEVFQWEVSWNIETTQGFKATNTCFNVTMNQFEVLASG